MSQLDAQEQELLRRDPDVRLMLQVKDDVQGAFETLMERYQNRLLSVMVHLVGDEDEAEDLTQEVLLRVYKARKGYKPRAKFSTWLFTIANNVALNHLRSKGRNPVVGMEALGGGGAQDSRPVLPADRVPGRETTASHAMRKVELSEVVKEAVATLGEDQRMAVLLNKFEDMSYAEIAEVMGRTEMAVKSLLARARMHLRSELEPYLKTGERQPGKPGRGEADGG